MTAAFSQGKKGSYLVCVSGEIDNSNDSSSDCIRLAVKETVEAVIQASTLRWGTGNTLNLSAALSVGAASYIWSGVDQFADTGVAETTWIAPQTPGIYQITLSINNGEDSDTVSVEVFDVLPVAIAEADAYVMYLDNGSAAFSLMSGSISTDGSDVETLLWRVIEQPLGSQISFSTVNQASTQFITNTAGDYTIQLVASRRGFNDTAEITLQVRTPNVPVADAGPDKVAYRNQVVNLTASNSINASKFSGYQWQGGAVADPDDIRLAAYVGDTAGLHQVCVVGNIGQSNNTSTACVDILVSDNVNTQIDDDAETGYTERFQFQVTDGMGNSNIATVIITLGWKNSLPQVVDAILTTPEETPAVGTLFASDVDGHALSYAIASNGSLGSAVISNAATGSFI